MGVRVNDAAIDSAVQLCTRHIGDRRHLNKAINLVKEAMARPATEIDSLSKEQGTTERKIRQQGLNVKHSGPRRPRKYLLHLRTKSRNE